jgi:truncated hemoglobin YjbI
MNEPLPIYGAMGGAAGCRALAVAFYARVAQDPVLRPFFPSTFKCAIEEFSAFLVQFLCGETEAMQGRWWLSLRESHARFTLGERERDSWMRAMIATLEDDAVVADARVRWALRELFGGAAAYVAKVPGVAVGGELGPVWNEQVALEEVIALARRPDGGERGVALLRGPELGARFGRSLSVHASFVSLALRSPDEVFRRYAIGELQAHPALVHGRYSHGRTLLHDAAGAGDVAAVELLLGLGANPLSEAEGSRSPLYCAGNECGVPSGGQVVRLLVQGGARVNAVHGVKRCTALHMAARQGHIEVIAALLDDGAEIEARDRAGDTALRRAVNCDKVEVARVLVKRGADVRSVGSKGLRVREAVRSAGMREVVGE